MHIVEEKDVIEEGDITEGEIEGEGKEKSGRLVSDNGLQHFEMHRAKSSLHENAIPGIVIKIITRTKIVVKPVTRDQNGRYTTMTDVDRTYSETTNHTTEQIVTVQKFLMPATCVSQSKASGAEVFHK